MPNYLHAWYPGGTYFFTVNLLVRKADNILVRQVDLLRETIRRVKQSLPLKIHGWVVSPDHLHCVIELTQDNVDFPLRWRLIKMGVQNRCLKINTGQA
ncbi:MAG: transposase [Gammaproteobacteria bacterium]